MQEEEAAAFQQGLLLSNLARASLGCLQGSVQQGRGRLVEHAGCLQAWVTLGSVAGTGTADRALKTRHMSTQPCEPRPPVKVAALAKRCWYSPFPSGIGVIFLWRWCLCWHKLLPSRAILCLLLALRVSLFSLDKMWGARSCSPPTAALPER